MTNPISGMSFQPGHGGGGGSFYMGRQPHQEEDEDAQDEPQESSELEADQLSLESPRRSQLSLPDIEAEAPPEEDWEATSAEIKGSLRYMTLAIAHMERDYARRQHAEIGSVNIFESHQPRQ